jgi:hypothetical protein
VILRAGQRLLVAGFDPATNVAKTAAVRADYNIPTNVVIYGPWSGKLNNAGETIDLLAPDKPDVTPTNVIVPYVLQERVRYSDLAPWPVEADGNGASLQRLSNSLYANDPASWFAGLPTAGAPANVATPPEITGISASGGQVILTMSTVSGRSYTLEYKGSAAEPAWIAVPPSVTAAGETLSLTNAAGSSTQRFYRVRMD